MTGFVRPLRLGKVTFKSNVFYSPLAGCSDFPFRQMCAEYHPGLIYCEMVKMEGLVRFEPLTFRMLDYSGDMHPIGGQIVGSSVKLAGQAARILEDMGFDVIDFNCGCPVDKVTRDGSGSGMLRQPERIGDIIAKMVAAVKVPVTVKIRTGWDDAHITAPRITEIAEQAGAAAIAVHGRTRKQGYRGLSNRAHIKACKEVAKNIKVIGNGDIFCAADALSMFQETGCDAVLVSRGTLGQPWIADDIYRLDRGEVVEDHLLEYRKEALMRHFEFMCRYFSDKRVVVDMRRVGCWYFKKADGAREFRGAISHAKAVPEIRQLVEGFSLYPQKTSPI